MEIAKLVRGADGSYFWVNAGRELAKAYPVNGEWRAKWLLSWPEGVIPSFPMVFRSALDACLAIEKRWPILITLHGVWVENANGGFFRKYSNFATNAVAKVRLFRRGWHLIDGMVS